MQCRAEVSVKLEMVLLEIIYRASYIDAVWPIITDTKQGLRRLYDITSGPSGRHI